jgi:hypothetical protein
VAGARRSSRLRLGRLVHLDRLACWALSSAATSRSSRARLRAPVRKACARGDSTRRSRRTARLRAKNCQPPSGSRAARTTAPQALRASALRPHKWRVRRSGYRHIRAQRRALPLPAPCMSASLERVNSAFHRSCARRRCEPCCTPPSQRRCRKRSCDAIACSNGIAGKANNANLPSKLILARWREAQIGPAFDGQFQIHP